MEGFAVAGLVLDVVGAYLLAAAVFFRTPERSRAESAPMYDYNAPLHLSLARQTADAQVGLVLLVVGFGLQAVSAAGFDTEGRTADGAVAAAAARIALVAWFPIRKRVQRRQEALAVVTQLVARRADAATMWRSIISTTPTRSKASRSPAPRPRKPWRAE